MIKLNEALKIGKFSNCEVLTGKNNLSREIKNVTIIENPEIANWIGEKELLITSLYSVKDDFSAQKKLINDVQEKGSTALAIKCGSHLKKIPEEILQQAEKNNFPIISIPSNVKYIDLIRPLMNFTLNNKLLLQEDVNVATVKLDKMLVEDNSLMQVLTEIEKILKKEIFFECDLIDDQDFKQDKDIVPLSIDQIKTLNIIKDSTTLEREVNGDKNLCLVTPIFIEGRVVGNITTFQLSDGLDTFQRAILQKAASILAIKILKVKLHKDIKQQYENDYVRTLLFSEKNIVNSNLSWNNYKITQETNFQVINIENLDVSNDLEYKMKNKIKSIVDSSLISFSENNINIILIFNTKPSGEALESVYNSISSYIKLNLNNYKIGIGNIGKGIDGLRKSYDQSKKAAFLAQEREILKYNKLGPYIIMDFLMNNNEVVEEFNIIIDRLERHNKDFMNTLICYFSNEESLVRTAEDLHIHLNTLKYRVKRIQEISGYNLQKTDEKFYLYLASLLHKIKNSR